MNLAVPVLIAFALWALLGGQAEVREVPGPGPGPVPPRPPPDDGPPPDEGPPPEIVGDAVTPELCWSAAYEVAASGNVDAMRQAQADMPPECGEAARYLQTAIDQILEDCWNQLNQAIGSQSGTVLYQVAEQLEARGCHEAAAEARGKADEIRVQIRAECEGKARFALDSGDPDVMWQVADEIQIKCPDLAQMLRAAAGG